MNVLSRVLAAGGVCLFMIGIWFWQTNQGDTASLAFSISGIFVSACGLILTKRARVKRQLSVGGDIRDSSVTVKSPISTEVDDDFTIKGSIIRTRVEFDGQQEDNQAPDHRRQSPEGHG